MENPTRKRFKAVNLRLIHRAIGRLSSPAEEEDSRTSEFKLRFLVVDLLALIAVGIQIPTSKKVGRAGVFLEGFLYLLRR